MRRFGEVGQTDQQANFSRTKRFYLVLSSFLRSSTCVFSGKPGFRPTAIMFVFSNQEAWTTCSCGSKSQYRSEHPKSLWRDQTVGWLFSSKNGTNASRSWATWERLWNSKHLKTTKMTRRDQPGINKTNQHDKSKMQQIAHQPVKLLKSYSISTQPLVPPHKNGNIIPLRRPFNV